MNLSEEKEILTRWYVGGSSVDEARTSWVGYQLKRSAEVIKKINSQLEQPVTTYIPLQMPQRTKHFVGREEEFARSSSTLWPEQVTAICGNDGLGKSALASELVWRLADANELLDRFPDGIIYHTFYGQSDLSLAFEHFIRSFKEPNLGNTSEAVKEVLTRKKALLFLDGLEEVDALKEILAVKGQCGLLITSRNPREPITEWKHLMPLSQEEAVQLLEAWNQRQLSNRMAAQSIVEWVKGLPLAICLIGRYLHATGESSAHYLSWLEAFSDRFSGVDAHYTGKVIHIMEHSLAQMGEDAQAIMSVVGELVPAPFKRESISVALNSSPLQIGRCLNELVEYGLLHHQPPNPDYEISHTLVYTYAHYYLPSSSQQVERLSQYYATLAREQSKLGLKGYARLDGERSHLMAVLRDCLDREDWEMTQSLAWAIDYYLSVQKCWTERIMALEAGLEAARASGNQWGEASFLGHLGDTYWSLRDTHKTIRYYEQALAVAWDINERREEIFYLCHLGDVYRELDKLKKASSYYEQALLIAQDFGDKKTTCKILGYLAVVAFRGENLEQAIEYHEQGVQLSRILEDEQLESNFLGSMGLVYSALGAVNQTIDCYQQSLALAQKIGDRRGEGADLNNLGNLRSALGEMEQAIKLYEQAIAIAQESEDLFSEGYRLGNLGNAYRAIGDTEKAIDYCKRALTLIHDEDQVQEVEGIYLGNLGITYLDRGERQKSLELLQEAVTILESYKSPQSFIYREQLAIARKPFLFTLVRFLKMTVRSFIRKLGKTNPNRALFQYKSEMLRQDLLLKTTPKKDED